MIADYGRTSAPIQVGFLSLPHRIVVPPHSMVSATRQAWELARSLG